MIHNELEMRFESVWSRLQLALIQSGRSVQLIAVSKKQPISAMQAYQIWANTRGIPVIFGENYVQEWEQKAPLLGQPFEVHFIGSLQRNKAREAVRLFDVIESVHSLALAESLNKEAGKISKKQRVLLQVNISADSKKSGFSVEETAEFFNTFRHKFLNLKIEGLMTITREYPQREDVRKDYRAMHDLVASISQSAPELGPLVLSMGMSQDFDIAIQEGADLVRVGSDLFGPRSTGSLA
jgi:pyridoxal phosphate enzyme (YggS family)